MVMWRSFAVVLFALGLTHAEARGQDRLAPAIQFYERGEFEQALAALDALPAADLDVEQRLATLNYRVLCLLALDRASDAESAMESLIALHPAYELGDETSPRVRRMFDEVRRRVVPDLMRRRYLDAKADYDAKRLEAALTGFSLVRDLGTAAGDVLTDPALRDLMQLADGFHALATAARSAAESQAAAAATGAATASSPPAPGTKPAPDARAAAAPATPPPAEPADRIFGPGDPGVTAAVPLAQGLVWRRGVPRPHAGAPLGTIEVVVDETGAVISSRVLGSVSAFYDAILTESARTWRYRPAVRMGAPVKFRRVVDMAAGR